MGAFMGKVMFSYVILVARLYENKSEVLVRMGGCVSKRVVVSNVVPCFRAPLPVSWSVAFADIVTGGLEFALQIRHSHSPQMGKIANRIRWPTV